jgi:GNAT superfamily N-acetyltransferase
MNFKKPIIIRPILPQQTYALRHAVLWPDKPYDYVKVENDPEGHHFGVFLPDPDQAAPTDDVPIAVISLFVAGTVARFRKFATHPDWQRQGIGTVLLQHTFAEARQLGATQIWCDARLTAADFYQRFGMAAEGDVFYKGPIAYAKFSVIL